MQRVEAFVAAWEKASEPPPLQEHLPAEPAALRRLVLTELIKVDLEYRWLHRKLPRPLEEYLTEFPELRSGGVPCDLVYEEFHIRKQAGDAVEQQQYRERFADQATEVERLLGVEASQTTTLLCNRRQVDQLDVGDRLDDFDLLVQLGKGAFASVFLARQRSMQRLVALKVSSDRGDEPQTLAQLDHPHIVRVHDQRILQERGLRLLYMQYVPGGTLQQVVEHVRQVPVPQRSGKTLLEAVDRALEARGEDPPAESALRSRLSRMSWPDAVCWLGSRLAGALEHAHRKGVLHRDVKPANVLLTAEGQPKLADFNISFSSKLEGSSPAAYFGGSLAYMSLEQLEAFNPRCDRPADSLDARADIFSLAVMLWELLTGHRPFPEVGLAYGWQDSLDRMMEQRRAGLDPAQLKELPAGCPPGLDRLLLACLSPNVNERPASGAELARQLELCLQPRTQKLLHAAPQTWRRIARSYPILALLLTATIPNALASAFNIFYNRQEIIDHLLAIDAAAEPVFWNVLGTINAIAFPLGMVLVAWYAWPIRQGLRDIQRGRLLQAERLRLLRQRCLRMGHFVAGLGIVEWSLAGFAYPVAMHVAVGELPVDIYLHFLASLALCGLIAAAYPFFAITLLSVNAWYPAFVRPSTMDERDQRGLDNLRRLTWIYLLLAASVPMLAVTLLVLIGSGNRLALLILGASGLAGFALAFWLVRLIQSDIEALAAAARRSDEPEGESFASSWSRSSS
jgi:serine/threonine protein kinase